MPGSQHALTVLGAQGMPVSQSSTVGGHLEALWEMPILICSIPGTTALSNTIAISLPSGTI